MKKTISAIIFLLAFTTSFFSVQAAVVNPPDPIAQPQYSITNFDMYRSANYYQGGGITGPAINITGFTNQLGQVYGDVVVTTFDLKIKSVYSQVSFKKKIGSKFTALGSDPVFVVKNDLGKTGYTSVQSISSNIIDNGDYYIVPTGTVSTIRIMSVFMTSDMPYGDRSIYLIANPALGTPVQSIQNVTVTPTSLSQGDKATVKWETTGADSSSKLNFKLVGDDGNKISDLGLGIPANMASLDFLAPAPWGSGRAEVVVTDAVNSNVLSVSPGLSIKSKPASTSSLLYQVNFSDNATIKAGQTAKILLQSGMNPTNFNIKVVAVPSGVVAFSGSYNYTKAYGASAPYVWTTKVGQALGDYQFIISERDRFIATKYYSVGTSSVFHIVSDNSISSVTTGPSSSFLIGDTLPITWSTSPTTKNVKVELFKGAAMIKAISAGVAASKNGINYVLPVTLVPGTDYTVKVTDKTNSSISITSSNFEINKPVINLDPSPTYVVPGQPITLTWTNTGIIKSFKVAVVSDSTGKSVTTKVVPSTAKTFIWKTTTKTTGKYKFTVTNAADTQNTVSSGVFEVTKTPPAVVPVVATTTVSVSTNPASIKSSFFQSLLGNVWSAISALLK